MIRLLRKGEKLNVDKLPKNHFGMRILGNYISYGTDYDFCRFYDYGGGYCSLFNSALIISGVEPANDIELMSFIAGLGAKSIEIDPTVCKKSPHGYNALKRRRFLLNSNGEKLTGIDDNPRLDDVYEIIRDAFSIYDYETWLADTSHRVRHGVSKVFLYEGHTTATVHYDLGGLAYVGLLCTKPEFRGQGHARKLLYSLADIYSDREIFLWTLEHRWSFYESCGFDIAETGVIYDKK